MTPVKIPVGFKYVRKREGRLVAFDQNRIASAVLKSMKASGEGDERAAEKVSDAVVRDLLKKYMKNGMLAGGAYPGIEEIQDLAETHLILMDFPKAAKSFILYRNERAKLREQRRTIPSHVKSLAEESKKYFRNPLAEFVYYRSYSRWIEKEGRRETWIETVERFMNYMKFKLGGKLTDEEYLETHQAILRQEVMPSMRLMWSAGNACEVTNVTAYNCSFIAPKSLKDLTEIMYISMCGAGVGFSVEYQNVHAFPQIKKQTGKVLAAHVIEDDKEGWCHALLSGLNAWFSGKDIRFDFGKIRPEGSRLKTMGGRTSGPRPLQELLHFSRKKILARQGGRLSTLDVHDIICKIGEIVVVGGVRRSALISLSDLNDPEMRGAKQGQFFLTDPQRQMANNSAVYNAKPTATEFMEEWLALAKAGTGERGIFNRGGLEKQLPARRWKVFKKHAQSSGTNPCVTGDTLVYVADGRGQVLIKQLAEEGKDVPVFCHTNRGGITVRMMRHPRLTGENQKVYKVTLDDGSIIKATENHKFRLRSGYYREVKDLKPGESLSIVTRFEASIKDIFPEANSRSSNYWWVNNGRGANIGEHRSIAEFHYDTKIPKGFIVHHKDRNAQNNNPVNLQILSKENHDRLHAALMTGDANPMRRAHLEWNEKMWASYRLKHSINNFGDRNKNFSGVSNEELKAHALNLTRVLIRRFSDRDWVSYAKEHNLPQCFSKWRQDHLGGIVGLAKWAARELGLINITADPRVVESYKKYSSQGYNCEIENGQLVISKNCEVCGIEFKTNISHREYGVCGISCGLKRKWSDPLFKKYSIQKIHQAHQNKKNKVKELQTKIYSDLKFELGREPQKQEWILACKKNGISPEISRSSSPFRYYRELKVSAENYNHKVVGVEFAGYEDVFNGTVDEFHNFFVGGFSGKAKNGKQKFVYLNNLQCGEIVLRSKQFCNLSEVVARSDDTERSLMKKIRIAAILGTYQSTLTNFPYLSAEWKKNCEEERLLGVSITGQWDCQALYEDKGELLKKLRARSVEINAEYAKRFGVNASTCVTCVKPSGTVSQLVDASSGLHPRHARHYLRRIRISATDSLFHMLRDQKVPYYPEVGQAEGTAVTYVIEFPVKAPANAVILEKVNAREQLEYWKKVKTNFTEHNPSVTISVGGDEWIMVANWLYENWDMLGGLSFLPRSEYVYALAPYESMEEKVYEEKIKDFPEIDFSQVLLYEKDDETEGAKEVACVSGTCEI